MLKTKIKIKVYVVRESEIFRKELVKLTPILGEKKILEIEKMFLAGDRKVRSALWDLTDAIKAAIVEKLGNIDFVFCPPPREILENGDITLGIIKYGSTNLYPMKIKKEILLNHLGIFGSTGYGKTNLIKYLIYQLAKLGISVIVFDFSKRNYRCLLSIKELEKKIKIYTVGRNISPLRFNPLIPPKNVEKSRWMKTFAEIFDHAYWMMGGGRYIILKAMDELDVSISASKNNDEIKLKDILAWIYAKEESFISPREKNWAATAKRALESLCFREIGEVFNTDEEFDIESLFENGKITIFELDSLSSNDRTFFIEIFMEHIREYLLENKERERINGVIVLEEAHHILNREKTAKIGCESIMDVVFREIRELGIGIIYADQHPSLISHTALGNTSTQIYFNLGLDTKNASDIEDAAAMLGLGEEEKNIIRKLNIGEAMMICRRLGYVSPFLLQFPKFAYKKEVSDEYIKNKFSSEKQEKGEMGRERKEIVERNGNNETNKLKVNSKEWEKIKLSSILLNEKEKEILKILYLGDACITSDIYSKAKLSGKRFKKISDDLKRKELIDFCEIRCRKGKMKVFFLTEKGKAVCKRMFLKDNNREEKKEKEKDLRIKKLISDEKDVLDALEKNGIGFLEKNNVTLVFVGKEKGITLLFKSMPRKGLIICENKKIMTKFLMYLAECIKNEKIRENMELKVNCIENIENNLKWIEINY